MAQPKKHADVNARMRAYRARLAAAPKPEAPEAKPKRVPTKPGKPMRRHLRTVAAEALAALVEQLQEHYDGKSERWQESDAGQEWQARIDAAQEALEAVEGLEEE